MFVKKCYYYNQFLFHTKLVRIYLKNKIEEKKVTYKLILISLLSVISLYAQENLRIGVLAYGTVNWELDVLKHHNLDKKYGFNLDVVELASKNAQLVSLQSKDVNMIVNDWIWVNTQKAKGKNMSQKINKRKEKAQKVKEMSVVALEKALASLHKKQKSKVR